MSKFYSVFCLVFCGSFGIQAMDAPRQPAARANHNPDAFAYLIQVAERAYEGAQEMNADNDLVSSSSSISEEDQRTEAQLAQTDVNFRLIVACRKGDINGTDHALRHNADPNAPGLDGLPALVIAARHYNGQRRTAVVRRLLSHPNIIPNPVINGRSLRDEMNQARRTRVVEEIDREIARRGHTVVPAAAARIVDPSTLDVCLDQVMNEVEVHAAGAVNYDSTRSQAIPVTEELLLAAAEEVQRASSEEDVSSESETVPFDEGVPATPTERLILGWRQGDRFLILNALRAGAISRLRKDEELLAQHGDVNFQLIIACRRGHAAHVAAALRAGANPNARGTDGFPAIVIVALHTQTAPRTRMIGHLFNAATIDPNPMIEGRTLMFIMNLLGRDRTGVDIFRGVIRFNAWFTPPSVPN